ncbi:MAG TPA: VOC family protein [Thermohalobaculum sp.]|nr:VOC family protein [Thermohalobaculum sp.]
MDGDSRLIVNIDVPDIELGIAFYQNGLEFEFRRRLFDGTIAEMSLQSVSVFLIEQSAGSEAVPSSELFRDYRNHWTPVHLDISVKNLGASISRALKAGASLSRGPSEHAFGQLAPMRDPFGHGFCLIEFSSDGYDAVVAS